LAVSQTDNVNFENVAIVFVILHLLVYPSSNGFNSLMDRDTGSIGLIKNPKKVPESMKWVTLGLDLISLLLTYYLFRWEVLVLLIMYILASRAYSYRGIRLKKYAIIGFLTVVIFQGPVIYILTKLAVSEDNLPVFSSSDILFYFVSLLLVGAGYPISQIYQHEQDKADGVKTLSMLLGIKGTFYFSLTMFIFLNVLLCYHFIITADDLLSMILFVVITSPVGYFFLTWMKKASKDPNEANYQNTMKMNLIGAICNNLFFMVLVIKNISN
jgi:1,4-dihydroxy-2-naphthoate octaprenyltransferase